MTVPDIKTELPGPKAKALIERDARSVSTSYTRSYPFVMARGEGSVVEDVDGNRFLDCAAGIAVTSTGHSHPEVVKAIVDQAQKFLHMSGTDFYYEPQVRLAEEIGAIVPIDGPVRTFFGNSGTEAIEAAIKLSRYHTKRPNLIAFLGSFHGRSLGALSLTSSKAIQRRGFGPLMSGVYHAPYPDCYRCPFGMKPDTCGAECASYIEDQILVHLVSPDEVAAIVVEPIQGEGGYIVPPKQFLERLAAITRKHGMLLVADEVQSGMGRSGKMFACEHFDLKPDVVAVAKGIASGLPLGRDRVARRRHDVAAGRARIDVRRKSRVVRRRAGDRQAPARHAREERRDGRRAHARIAPRACREASSDRRRPRQGADDWRRAGTRPSDERARHLRARRRRRRDVPAGRSDPRRRTEHRPLRAPARPDEAAVRFDRRRSSTPP